MNKPGLQYLNQTSFHDVTSNSTSSGLRGNVILTNTHYLTPKLWWKNWHHCEREELGVPYLKGLIESFKRVWNSGSPNSFQGGNTIRELLMAPKNKDNITKEG